MGLRSGKQAVQWHRLVKKSLQNFGHFKNSKVMRAKILVCFSFFLSAFVNAFVLKEFFFLFVSEVESAVIHTAYRIQAESKEHFYLKTKETIKELAICKWDTVWFSTASQNLLWNCPNSRKLRFGPKTNPKNPCLFQGCTIILRPKIQFQENKGTSNYWCGCGVKEHIEPEGKKSFMSNSLTVPHDLMRFPRWHPAMPACFYRPRWWDACSPQNHSIGAPQWHFKES